MRTGEQRPWQRIFVGKTLAILAVSLAMPVHSQTADSFNPSASDPIYGVALQPDGRIILGGYFHDLGAPGRNYLVRLQVDGSVDTTFNPGPDYGVSGMAVQDD